MSNFALVTCTKDHKKDSSDKNVFARFSKKIKGLFVRRSPQSIGRSVEFSDGSNCLLIKLPYSLDKISKFSEGKLNKIDRLISTLCSENSIGSCILSRKISEIHKFESCTKHSYTGSYLFRALLINILEEIYTNEGVRLSDLDITVIQGKSAAELEAVLWLLSSFVKYITVITNDKESIQDLLDGLYDETGLSVGVAGDFVKGLKHADFIINLGCLAKNHFGLRREFRPIFLNYGECDINKIPEEITVIQGIDVSFPKDLSNTSDDETLEFFSRNEIAEVILCHKLNLEKESLSPFNFRQMQKLSREFSRTGFRIEGFLGRHNILGVDELTKSIFH